MFQLIFSLLSSSRSLCEDPAWAEMRGCKLEDAGIQKTEIYVFCGGRRPSQFIQEADECDGNLGCIDRSDEEGCVFYTHGEVGSFLIDGKEYNNNIIELFSSFSGCVFFRSLSHLLVIVCFIRTFISDMIFSISQLWKIFV